MDWPKPLTRFLAVLTLGLLAVPAAAQQAARPVAAVLTQITLVSEAANETRLRLAFAPQVNGYDPIPDPAGKPALGLALTTRGNGAVTPSGLTGLVRGIQFDQVEQVLILRFASLRPAAVKVLDISPTAIEVTIAAVPPAPPHPDQPAAPLPAAVDPAPGSDGFALVMLKYADVSEVVGLLTDGLTVSSNDLFVPREPAFGSNSLAGGSGFSPGPVTQSPGSDDKPLGQSVDSAIAVDRRLNAIWLKGSPERIARLKAEIAQIDVPLDSVILETELVELTESGARAIGLDFANANGQAGVATFQTGGFLPSGWTGGGHLTSAALQAALYLQVQKGEGRIVSKPRIAAQSGSTAKIITGDALPILTSITLSGVNGVSQQVQYVNVGVTLQIAPRVSADGFVSSHVFCEVSSVTGYSQGYPTISQREAETSATVLDGESFVIGGLVQDERLSSRSAVPLLGAIPLLGQAFRHDSATLAKTELYIVITPHILRRAGPAPSGPTP
jgi:general secretion pathway protein D